jgi:hypothetical protein
VGKWISGTFRVLNGWNVWNRWNDWNDWNDWNERLLSRYECRELLTTGSPANYTGLSEFFHFAFTHSAGRSHSSINYCRAGAPYSCPRRGLQCAATSVNRCQRSWALREVWLGRRPIRDPRRFTFDAGAHRPERKFRRRRRTGADSRHSVRGERRDHRWTFQQNALQVRNPQRGPQAVGSSRKKNRQCQFRWR